MDDKVVSAYFQLLMPSSMPTTCHSFAEFLKFNLIVKRKLLKILWSLTSGYAERVRQNTQYLPPIYLFFHLSHSLRFYDSL